MSKPIGRLHRVSQKVYKVNQPLLKIMNVNQLFITILRFYKNSEPSFVGVYQILIEIRLFEHEFGNRNFGQFRIFGGIKFANKLFSNFLHFIGIELKLKRKGETSYFY